MKEGTMVVIVLLFLSLIALSCSAFGVGTVAGVQFLPLGLALFVAAALWPLLKIG